MNNLNSILLEGTLKTKPEFSIIRKTPECRFTVVSKRTFKDNDLQTIGEVNTEETEVEVETCNELASRIKEQGKKGRGVRVVGRLKQKRYYDVDGRSASRIVIAAEHVEFRPEYKKDTID
jgi:single-strand DNA-binding protein